MAIEKEEVLYFSIFYILFTFIVFCYACDVVHYYDSRGEFRDVGYWGAAFLIAHSVILFLGAIFTERFAEKVAVVALWLMMFFTWITIAATAVYLKPDYNKTNRSKAIVAVLWVTLFVGFIFMWLGDIQHLKFLEEVAEARDSIRRSIRNPGRVVGGVADRVASVRNSVRNSIRRSVRYIPKFRRPLSRNDLRQSKRNFAHWSLGDWDWHPNYGDFATDEELKSSLFGKRQRRRRRR